MFTYDHNGLTFNASYGYVLLGDISETLPCGWSDEIAPLTQRVEKISDKGWRAQYSVVECATGRVMYHWHNGGEITNPHLEAEIAAKFAK